jgi:hypothetical protein
MNVKTGKKEKQARILVAPKSQRRTMKKSAMKGHQQGCHTRDHCTIFTERRSERKTHQGGNKAGDWIALLATSDHTGKNVMIQHKHSKTHPTWHFSP